VTRRPSPGRTLASLWLALSLLGACAAPPVVPVRSDLVVGLVGDLGDVLDDPAGAAVAALIAEPLVRRTATEQLEPRLAERVPALADDTAELDDAGRLVATFRIREGARWHDGAPVVAEDVRFAFEQDREAAVGSARRSTAERIDRVEVVDDRTVRVAYRARERWDLFALAPRALPRHLLATEDARASYRFTPAHAGPYRIVARSASTLTLARFEDHPIDRPRIERIVVRAFADRTALLAALGRGEIDVAPSPSLDADLARTLDRSAAGAPSQAIYTPAQAVAMLRLAGAFAEPAVRDAVRLAVDRDRISRSVFAGRVRATDSYLVPPLWAAADLGLAGPPDRAASRAALARAGYRAGGFGVLRRDGTALEGTILVPRGHAALLDVARAVAGDLAVIGVAVSVSPVDPARLRDRVRDGEYDLAVVEESADDALLATERYRGLVSPWFDVLAGAAREVPSRAEQRALYQEIQRLWAAEAPAVPLYQVLKVDVVPARLEGVRPAAHGAPLTWNAAEWRLVERR
jgi:peptide/nickel transport system substrate-binding protein